MIRYIIIICLFSYCNSQNIDLYISLIDEGKIEGVMESLPELISKYPNNPGVLYLKARLTQEGSSALKQYKYILKNYSNSEYAPIAAMKIGEYFYARGLYTQSANLLKSIPVKYPRFKDMQRLTDLMVSSFNAIGEADSARYYALIIKSMFPKIETININTSSENRLSQVFEFNKKKPDLGPYIVQVGAFGNKENANRLKLQVSQLGHDVSINNIESNGKNYYAVRVNRFHSKKKAEIVGRDIKSKIGIQYRVLYRPK